MSIASPARRVLGASVRSRLVLMALSLVTPAAVLMILLTLAAFRESQQRYEQQLIATTRALGVAADRQIAQGQATLQALAVSPALRNGDLAAFDQQARQAVPGPLNWILLADETGQRVNTLAPRGAVLPPGNYPEDIWDGLRAGRTVVSNLTTGPVARRPVVGVVTPTLVDGRLHGLGFVHDPAAYESLFRAQNLPDSWTGSIVDRKFALVARSKGSARLRGRLASPQMRQAITERGEGVVLTHTLDGTPTLSAFSRSPAYGWTFVVGVPRTEVYASVTRSMIGLSVATGLLLALGVGLAVVFSIQISRQVRSLAADAQLLAEDRIVETRSDDLVETAQVREALHRASLILRVREEEQAAAGARQEVMINELNHRVKNTLAMIQSLARQSLKGADAGGLTAFTERLVALSRAHDLLSERIWQNADLADVVDRGLNAFGARATGHGPSLSIAPNAAVTLSMILHELATNAVKYGALSNDTGQVELLWNFDSGKELTLVWRERGGPTIAPPDGDGFGSRLITASVQHEFGGTVQFDHRPQGLVCTLIIPLSERLTGQPATADATDAIKA
ncbi:HWE histidine kinase domain-containing protein [Caulobacter sp. SLTY]|uniref:sensor histidine kinase n=1 Tax=Caulobacter sp. SLTY TaxID=2683262 RepID=UPI003211E9AB